MAIYNFKTEQILPIDINQAWQFFSSPNNLSLITPPEMNFRILTKLENNEDIYEGMIIDYRLKPIFGIPMKWQTRIGKLIPNKVFTDTQSKGPYKLWEHTHYFEEIENGVKMTDVVNYQLPLGILGDIAYFLFVKNKIKGIFNYRRRILEEIFKAQEHVIN